MEITKRSISLLIEGDRAFFPRPEFRRDHVTYEVLTPAAAKGILDRIHWRPAIQWTVDRIHVQRPIQLELMPPANTAHGKSLVLKDVRYVLEAHFDLTDRAGDLDEPARHLGMFRRAVRRSDTFFGRDDFPAAVRLLENGAISTATAPINQDFGWLLHGADYSDRGRLRFFRAKAVNGVVDVPPPGSPDLFG